MLTSSSRWALVQRGLRGIELPDRRVHGGKLEDAQEMAGHADARTTKMYIRNERKIAQAEFERVQL